MSPLERDLDEADQIVTSLELRGWTGSGLAMMRALIAKARTESTARPVFRHVGAGRFEVGAAGETRQTLDLGATGVLAWLALDGQVDEANRALDASPRDRNRAMRTRAQLRRMADRLERFCPALSAEIRAISVSAVGVLQLQRQPRAWTR